MGRQWLQYERRMDIVQTLKNGRQETISNLAARYGASERTIAYDLDALTADYHIEIVRGRYGGVKLVPQYQDTLSSREQEFLLRMLPSWHRRPLCAST